MTESEWPTSVELSGMLVHAHGHGSDRKCRLFECACVRRLWSSLADERSRMTVELVERFADGLEDMAQLQAAKDAAQAALQADAENPGAALAAWAAAGTTSLAILSRAAFTAARAVGAPQRFARWVRHEWIEEDENDTPETLAEFAALADLVREIFGNPFHPVSIDPAWLTAAVTGLTQAIYKDRAFDRLPILADALEEAGCTDAEILNHCRQPGEHWRGCWVVDLLLGKQ